MNLTVTQLLTIVGRLDDSPGFDTPRERFRRLLNERMTDAESARAIIHECRQMAGEQNHRALQDAVVLTGKLLGFLTTFGSYQHDPGTAPVGGQWESRRRLRVLMALCGGQIAGTEFEAFAKAVRNEADRQEQAATPRVGVCVVSPFYPAKARLEEMLRTRTYPELRLMSLESLLRLADMVAAGQLTHDDVLQVLHPDVNLDAVVDLLDRRATIRPSVSGGAADGRIVPNVAPATDHCWIAAIRLTEDTSAEQLVDSLIAKRRLLPINPASEAQRSVQPGDAVCICVAGTGFVADGRVAGLVTDRSSGVRDAERFTQVLQLSEVTVYSTPVVPASDMIRRFELAPNANAGAVVTPVSRHEFEWLTRAAATSAHS